MAWNEAIYFLVQNLWLHWICSCIWPEKKKAWW